MIKPPQETHLVLLNKPFNVLCQFSAHENKKTLAGCLSIPGIYPAGRLDYDSEGLLLLTNNGKLQSLIAHPKYKLAKEYWVQVEGIMTEDALGKLRAGITLKDGITSPAGAETLSEPTLWPRNPPIRQRDNIPTSWVKITLKEGKNRQVRRMTAAVGFPTLRLIRAKLGHWDLSGLKPGEWKTLPAAAIPEDMLSLINQPQKNKHPRRQTKHKR